MGKPGRRGVTSEPVYNNRYWVLSNADGAVAPYTTPVTGLDYSAGSLTTYEYLDASKNVVRRNYIYLTFPLY